MPRYQSSGPVSVSVEIGAGSVHVVAGEGGDVLAEAVPSDPARHADVTAADQTRIEFADGRLSVRTPRGRRRYGPFGEAGAVELRVTVPQHSTVVATTAHAAFRGSGLLGDCRVRTGAGDIHVAHAATASLVTGSGDIRLERATGDVVGTSGSGGVQAGTVQGGAILKASDGDCVIDMVHGALRISTANGSITVRRADSSVTAKAANGSVRLDEVAEGEVVVATANGGVAIGVRPGTAAWLDLHTSYGQVRVGLEPASGADATGGKTLAIRARSAHGDIDVNYSGVPTRRPARAELS
jgi:DUF4097 and DUF4098 domain-containing protein YvlB